MLVSTFSSERVVFHLAIQNVNSNCHMKHSRCGKSHDVHRCWQPQTTGYILLPSFITSKLVSTPNLGQHQVIQQEYKCINSYILIYFIF